MPLPDPDPDPDMVANIKILIPGQSLHPSRFAIQSPIFPDICPILCPRAFGVEQVTSSVRIHLNVSKASPCVVLHAAHMTIERVSLQSADGQSSDPGAHHDASPRLYMHQSARHKFGHVRVLDGVRGGNGFPVKECTTCTILYHVYTYHLVLEQCQERWLYYACFTCGKFLKWLHSDQRVMMMLQAHGSLEGEIISNSRCALQGYWRRVQRRSP